MTQSFDLLVIGGGSGGIASAIQAARLGATCAVVEARQFGGTCVNLGCVPKKIMWNASHIAELLAKASDYAFQIKDTPSLDWTTLVAHREQYIAHLRQIYTRRLQEYQIQPIAGHAHFVNHKEIVVNDRHYTADHIIIATGSEPRMPDLPGIEHTISSDGFFALREQPQKVVVIGGGYVGVEIAGLLNALGSEVHLLLRHGNPLSRFDPMLGESLYEFYQQQGIQLTCDHQATGFSCDAKGGVTVNCANGHDIDKADCVLLAVGRQARSAHLNLDATGVQVDEHGIITTDKYENTNVPGIYAIGDVNGKPALTPVAIAAGRRLATRLFSGQTEAHLNYDLIPTVVFTHPPIGSIGMSEPQARDTFGADNVTVYQTEFTPLLDALSQHTLKTRMKLITVNEEERIVGCHIIGYGADEMLQGFAVAITMGARKRDFDNTIAIHPTSAEELVTLKKG